MPTLEEIRQKYPGAYDDLSDVQLSDALYNKHYSDMPRAEFNKKLGVEQFDVGMGQIQPTLERAARALPGSVKHAGEQLWDLVTNYDRVYKNVKELGFGGVAKAIGSDLVEHYGSLDKAKKTFETDPFRFLMDVSAVGTGGGSLLAKLPGVAGRIGEAAAGVGRAIDPLAMAGRVGADVAGRAGSSILGRTAGTGKAAMEQAEAAGITGGRMPAATRPWLRPDVTSMRGAVRTGAGALGLERLDALTGGHVGHMIGQHPALAGTVAASTSPRLAGSTMYGLGAAQRYGERLAPAARTAAGVLPGRKEIQQEAKEKLKDKQFKDRLRPDELKAVRKVARDPNADSRTMSAAQRVLGGYRPLQLTVRPEQGAYGGPEGGQANDAVSGVVSRQEGGPLAAGQPAVVGETPGGEPRPELFVPDRGPSPAQAAGAAGTEALSWISDAWGSILRGEKPPPLPDLPETGKVPSTADPRPVQALGEQTSALSQLVGPPGAAAAKGLGAAALGAAAGKKLLKGAAEEVARPAARELGAAEKAAPLADAPFPQYAKEYPPIGEPVMTWDKAKGRYYPAKGESPEAAAFLKAREKIREQMKTEGYTPYFDPAARTHVDPSGYPARTTETLDIVPKKREALDKHLQAINAPEVRKRLRDAIKKGQTLGDTADWYAMGQLESEFVKEFGAKQGRTEFLNTFAAPMAATTGGMDPTGNLLLASYLNYLRAGSKALPTESWQVPKGFGGGKYGVMPNIRQYETKMEGGGYGAFGAENPKRLDFMRAFLGDRYHPVMDEQMTQGMTPGLSQPPPGTYGLYARKAIEVGKEQGLKLTPDDVQAIAWAGFKDEAGKPMISHFNDAVERTHRLTGMPRQEIVRGWMRREIPLYGGAGATIMAPELARETAGDRQ